MALIIKWPGKKLTDGYVALYGTAPIQIKAVPNLNDIFWRWGGVDNAK